MFKLNKNATNTVTLRLYSKTTVSPVYYLFEFENDQTHVKSYCIPTDTSTETESYNRFSIEDTASPVPLNGEVELTAGNYTYRVYEQTSSTNLNPANADEIEVDCCQVLDTTTYTNTYYTPTLTNTVYEG
jgi:hypothetical protein